MRIVMMGTGVFAEPTLTALLESQHEVAALFTQPDRTVGRERSTSRLSHSGMKDKAEARKIAIHQPESVNTPDGVTALSSLQADLLVVAAYGQILSNEVLASTRLGGINVHASLLPKYRGAAPINWAIYHGETQTGVTIIRMTSGLDAGDILAQEAMSIEPGETAGELESRLAPLGARLALEVIDRLALGPVAGRKQDPSQATKAPKLKKEMGLIDWKRPAQAICNQVRAFQPFPSPYTFYQRPQHEPLRVQLLVVSEGGELNAPPGAVLAEGHRLYVVAGERSSVEILELQPAGKRRMKAADFLRGYPVKPDSWMRS